MTGIKIHIDFETRSTVDLREVGAYRYAAHPDTGIWCMAVSFRSDEEPYIWTPEMGRDETIESLVSMILAPNRDVTFHAWNAQFERAIWRYIMVERYGLPDIPLGRWRDTMARAANLALPRSLKKAAEVLLPEQRKDDEGHRLMMRMARPRRVEDDGTVVWWDVPERRQRLEEYCRKDVVVEREIDKLLGPMDDSELEIWRVDQRMNDRGITIDTLGVRSAQAIVAEETERVNRRVAQLTDGAVDAVTNHMAIRAWVNDRGVATDTVAKDWLEEALEGDGLPSDVRQVLQLRLDAGKSSTAKLERMAEVPLRFDDRARGLLQYFGADTGRWSGRLIQPQNLPRGSVDASDPLLHLILAGEDPELVRLLYGPPLDVVSGALRGYFLAADGRDLIGVDYSAIEARVLPWLAGQQDLVDQFAEFDRTGDRDTEPYVVMANKLGMDRQGGKVTILGAGYQMGWQTFIQHAKGYGVELSEQEARRIIYDVYRVENHRIAAWWQELQEAALAAVKDPGLKVQVGRVSFQRRGWFLWMALPSGRELAYADPAVVMRPMPWDETDLRPAVRVWHVDGYTRQWTHRDLYGGLLAENATQAVARDVMAAAMVRLETDSPYTPLLTIHDEILCEVPRGEGSVEEMSALMTEPLPWSEGLPIAASGWRGKRYRKD